MATYGSVRLLIQKANPGVDLELIDGWFSDRYSQIILGSVSWKRLEGEFIIQSPASYNVGTITANQGNAAIVGDGTGAWTAAMTGRMIRINQGQEYYQFNYVDATHATLDRPYEGTTSSIVASNIDNPGSGYQPGDQFWVTGGNSLAQGTIETIGAGGSVASYSLSNTGNNYAVGNGVICTGGFGTGFTIDITAVGGSSLLPYRIDQNIFVMPAEMRILRSVRPMHDWLTPLEVISPHKANLLFGQRNCYGTPTHAVQTWDSTSDPPRMQLELLPVPSNPSSIGNTLSWAIDHIYDPAPLDPSATSATLLPWMDPTALKEGVGADIATYLGKLDIAANHETKFDMAVKRMGMVNAQQRGPQAMRLHPQFLGNGRRGGYGYGYGRGGRGSWREGWNG